MVKMKYDYEKLFKSGLATLLVLSISQRNVTDSEFNIFVRVND